MDAFRWSVNTSVDDLDQPPHVKRFMMKLDDALPQLKISSKAKRLRPFWPAIEATLAEGVSHAEILNRLNDLGFQLTAHTYRSYLYRYRKRRRSTEPPHPPIRLTETSTPKSAEVMQVTTFPASTEVEKHKRPPTFDYDPRGISPELLK